MHEENVSTTTKKIIWRPNNLLIERKGIYLPAYVHSYYFNN